MKAKLTAIIILISGIVTLYLLSLPETVQMGDTGELIRSAFELQVAHPPGYPLFIWLMHFGINLVSVGTVFWRAAFITSFISLITCITLFLNLRNKPWIALLLALTLASSRIFWKFSVLPDVFALNMFFAGIISFVYLDPRIQKYRAYLPAIFLIGLSHHLTLVFLSPIIIHAGLINIKSRKMWATSFIALGGTICLYGSMILMSPDHFNSWGNINSITSVFFHFLRNDYGTFKLMATNEVGSTSTILSYLGSQTLNSFLPIILVGIVLLTYRIIKLKNFDLVEYIFSSVILLYVVVFFSLSNIELVGFKVETIERFFILVHLLLCFWIAIQISKSNIKKKFQVLIAVILTFGVFWNIFNFYNENNFSRNTIISDYSINLLNETNTSKPSVLLTLTDTKYGALQYVQSVLDIHPEVLIVHPRKLFFKWFLSKIEKTGLSIDSKKILESNKLAVEEDFILPNLDKVNFYTNLDFKNPNKYLITVLPIGRKLESGTGVLIADSNELKWIQGYNFKDLKSNDDEYNIHRDIWTEYGTYFYLSGLAELERKNFTQAQKKFEKALEVVPWYTPAQKKICELQSAINPASAIQCEDKLKNIKTRYFNYL